MEIHDSSSYDIRIVSFIGKYWKRDPEERLFQVIAEGPNHAIIAEGTGRTIKRAFKELKAKLDYKLSTDQLNG